VGPGASRLRPCVGEMRFPVKSLRRWKEQLRRPGPTTGHDHLVEMELLFRRLTAEVEQGLRGIDFDEVTIEDRITFVECAVAWQVRRALHCGRFDLALRLRRFGSERIAQLLERAHGWRPVLLYGMPSASGGDAERSG
jgi:hypothetical protein